jgi:hypothetical protein
MFAQSPVLYLSDQQALLYRIKGQQIQPAWQGANDFASQQRLQFYLQQQPLYRLKIVLDSGDELFLLKLLPRLNSRQQTRLIKTQGQLLFAKMQHQAWVKASRGSQIPVLFSGLLAYDNLQPWLELLLEQKIAIDGVYSHTLLLHHLVSCLSLPPHCLLLSHQAATAQQGLIRHSFWQQQHLQFSRLLAWHPDEPKVLHHEIQKTRDYLRQQNLLPNDADLEIWWISDSAKPPSDKFQPIDLLAWAKKCGWHQPQPTLPQLLVWFLSQRQIKNHYADKTTQRYVYHHRFKRLLYGLSALSLIGSVIMGGYWWQQSRQLQQKTQQIQTDNKKQQAEFAQLTPTNPSVNLAQLKHSLWLVAQLKKQPQPFATLLWLGQQLRNQPKFQLNQLDWSSEAQDYWWQVSGSWLQNAPYHSQQAAIQQWTNQLQQDRRLQKLSVQIQHPNLIDEGKEIHGQIQNDHPALSLHLRFNWQP